MKIIVHLLLMMVLFLLAGSCTNEAVIPPITTIAPVTNPTATTPPATTTPSLTTPPITTPPIIVPTTTPTITTPPATTTPAVTAPPATILPMNTATFDFDTGSPRLAPGQNTPLEQMSGGITARFSSPSDPAAFSVQTSANTFLRFSSFSGNFLYDNSAARKPMSISFNYPLSSINLTFATTDYHGPANVEEPSYVKLTAYLNSTETMPVGTATARGTFGSDSFPQGKLSFKSEVQPFNIVVIELLPQPRGGSSFYVDDIMIKTSD